MANRNNPRSSDGPGRASRTDPSKGVKVKVHVVGATTDHPSDDPHGDEVTIDITELSSHHLHLPKNAEDGGEDALPICCHVAPYILLAAFDGMGGRGAKLHDGPLGERTQAWYAARAARDAIVDLIQGGPARGLPLSEDQVREKLTAHFDRVFETPGSSPSRTSKLRGKLIPKLDEGFPTTLVLAQLDTTRNVIDIFWAGDSRCYLVNGRRLLPLTCDDNEVTDLLAAYKENARLTNYVQRGSFQIRHRRVQLNETPYFLFVCTDGLHDEWDPLEFAEFLTHQVSRKDNLEDFVAELKAVLKDRPPQDDVSAAFHVVGDWADLQRSLTAFKVQIRADLQRLRRHYDHSAEEKRKREEHTKEVQHLDDVIQTEQALKEELDVKVEQLEAEYNEVVAAVQQQQQDLMDIEGELRVHAGLIMEEGSDLAKRNRQGKVEELIVQRFQEEYEKAITQMYGSTGYLSARRKGGLTAEYDSALPTLRAYNKTSQDLDATNRLLDEKSPRRMEILDRVDDTMDALQTKFDEIVMEARDRVTSLMDAENRRVQLVTDKAVVENSLRELQDQEQARKQTLEDVQQEALAAADRLSHSQQQRGDLVKLIEDERQHLRQAREKYWAELGKKWQDYRGQLWE